MLETAQNLALLYLGGSLAIAVALLAIARRDEVRPALRQNGARRSVVAAAGLCLLWLPVLLAAIVAPRWFNQKR